MAFRNFLSWFKGTEDDDVPHIDPAKRYFTQVSGLEQVLPEDVDAQKDLCLKAVPEWAGVDRESLKVKNISGLGGSQTYMVSCKGQCPRRVVVHNKKAEMTEEEVISERIQERVVFELSKVDATPGRISEGESWYIEPCAGTPLNAKDLPVNKIADCSARLHEASIEWFEEFRASAIKNHP